MAAVRNLLMRPQRLFVWLVPACWIAGCLVGFRHPGDEYALFALGSLAGLWVMLVVGDTGSTATVLAPMLLAGVATMALFGVLLDRLRASWRVWLVALLAVAGAALWLLLHGHADLDAARQKHGSLLAFGICALQLGGYGATLLTLCLAAVRGAAPGPAVASQRLL